MESYNVMTLNTSALGEDAIRGIANDSSGGVLGGLGIPSSVASGLLGSLGNEIADGLATQLGIGEFYTVHALDFCQGNFEPSPTTPGASHNVTFCSTPLDFGESPTAHELGNPRLTKSLSYIGAYNLTNKLTQELSVGPFHFTLSQLGVSESTQQQLNELPKVAKALAGLFIVTVILTGLAMLGSAAGFLLLPTHGARTMSFFNFLLALLAVVLLLAGALVATIGPRLVAQKLQDTLGSGVGLEVIANIKLATLMWAAFALETLAMFIWFYELVAFCVRRRRTGAFGEKSSAAYGK